MSGEEEEADIKRSDGGCDIVGKKKTLKSS